MQFHVVVELLLGGEVPTWTSHRILRCKACGTRPSGEVHSYRCLLKPYHATSAVRLCIHCLHVPSLACGATLARLYSRRERINRIGSSDKSDVIILRPLIGA